MVRALVGTPRPYPLRRYGTERARERPPLYYYCPEPVSLLQRPPMQPAPPAKDVLLLVHDVDVPKSERDVDLELADADIAMHPVTGKVPMHPKHESACSAQLFRLAFPCHVLLMAVCLALHGWMAIMAAPSVMVFWALAALCSAFGLLVRVLLHQMHDLQMAQRIGSWGWTVLMLQDCVFGITGYVATPYQDACNVSRVNYVQGSAVMIFSALALAMTNGTHGMSFGHKTALIGLMLASALVVFGVCGKAELVLMLCEMTSLVIGYAVAHMAELFLRHAYAEKVLEKRRMGKEKRRLEERNEQLEAEKERLLYDVQRKSRPLADDDRSAIGRGLQAKNDQPYPASDADWSEPGAPSDSAPPSFPPGPPSSSARSVPLSWADCYTEADRQHWIAKRSETDQLSLPLALRQPIVGSAIDQKVGPPLAEIGHQLSATSVCASSAEIAAPATKRKATPLATLRADRKGKPARRVTKAGSKHNKFLLKVAPLTWAEADRRHYAEMAAMDAQLVTVDQKVGAILADHRVGNARVAPSAVSLDPSNSSSSSSSSSSSCCTPLRSSSSSSGSSLLRETPFWETLCTQAQAAAVALAAMANGGGQGRRASSLV